MYIISHVVWYVSLGSHRYRHIRVLLKFSLFIPRIRFFFLASDTSIKLLIFFSIELVQALKLDCLYERINLNKCQV